MLVLVALRTTRYLSLGLSHPCLPDSKTWPMGMSSLSVIRYLAFLCTTRVQTKLCQRSSAIVVCSWYLCFYVVNSTSFCCWDPLELCQEFPMQESAISWILYPFMHELGSWSLEGLSNYQGARSSTTFWNCFRSFVSNIDLRKTPVTVTAHHQNNDDDRLKLYTVCLYVYIRIRNKIILE